MDGVSATTVGDTSASRPGQGTASLWAAAGRRRTARWVAAGLAVCAALSLRNVALENVTFNLDASLGVTGVRAQAAWALLDNLGWAALTPLVLFLARRVPFRRDRWAVPLGFHLLMGTVVSGVGGTLVGCVGDIALKGYRLADFPSLLDPVWIQYAAYRVYGDTLTYWLVLGAEYALFAYEEDQARQRQNAELERSLVAAQVDALKMKLQPHFLFNTLNSISFLAMERDTGALVTMIERLGGLLRSSMRSGGSQLVALGEELALLDQYLSIEEVRFADRLSVGRAIEPAAVNALVPSLVLQPIVENSIKHGFSRRIDARRIDLAVTRDGDALVFTVADDGPGMPDGWSLETHCGRGLRNVIDRIQRLYPGAWSFSLANRPGGGAIAALRIPWQAATATARPAGPGWRTHHDVTT